MPEEAKCSIIEEYARFLAAITPKIGDSVKEPNRKIYKELFQR